MKQKLSQIFRSTILLLFSFFTCSLSNVSFGQTGGVSINNTNTAAHPSAILDVSSTSAPYLGMLIPRMSTANRNNIQLPATGLMVFNTDCGVNEYYTGNCWVSMGQNLKAPPPIICSGTTAVCANDSRTFIITPVNGATSYSWTVPAEASISSGQGTASVTVVLGNYSGEVCVTAESACETSPSRCIDVHVISPSLPVISTNSPICSGSTLTLSSTSLPAIYSFSWTGPNGFASSQQNPSIANATTSASGTYSLTVSSGGCSSVPLTTPVTVNALPQTPVASASPNPVCQGSTLNLSASMVTNATYSWTGPNNFTASTQNPTIANAQAGTYSVIASVSGCNSAEGTISVLLDTPISAFTSSSPKWPNTSITFSPSITNGATYSWLFTSGSPSSSTLQSPSVIWSATGTYNVSLTITINGCSSTTANSITIINPTVVSFTNTGTTSWTAPGGVSFVEVLVVAGGGSGGGWGTGGGGGGIVFRNAYTVTPGSQYTVTVGGGGAGGASGGTAGSDGGNSVFDTLIALGGGGGGGYGAGNIGRPGGSGGGGDPGNWTNGAAGGAGLQPGSSSGGYGNAGGISAAVNGNYDSGGGGGGAGVAGGNGSSSIGGSGGDGLPFNITGSTLYYGGGGAGKRNNPTPVYATGGAGGGGSASAGSPNTGGGGSAAGYAGGSGIVVIKY